VAARRFHELTVAAIERQTDDAVVVALNVPEALREVFAFQPGQYLTLAAELDGAPVRRSYSICSSPGEATLKVGIKRVADGRFSRFVNDELSPGATLKVMPPEGRFTAHRLGGRHDYLLIAAGSGITPMLSIAATVLAHEPESTVSLVYGNRSTATIMFEEELQDLKDLHLGRFILIQVLSRESQDVALFNGRLDGARIVAMAERGLISPSTADGVFLCGPGAMIDDIAAALAVHGVAADKIRVERFTLDGELPAGKPPSPEARQAARDGTEIEVLLDGVRRSFAMREQSSSVLDAAHAAGLELPYSCAAGMCSTCRCRVVEGSGEMAVNYSLEPWELAAGFTLACQTRPTSRRLVLDFDAV